MSQQAPDRAESWMRRGKKVAKFLLIEVPEVEIEIKDRGLPSIAQG